MEQRIDTGHGRDSKASPLLFWISWAQVLRCTLKLLIGSAGLAQAVPDGQNLLDCYSSSYLTFFALLGCLLRHGVYVLPWS